MGRPSGSAGRAEEATSGAGSRSAPTREESGSGRSRLHLNGRGPPTGSLTSGARCSGRLLPPARTEQRQGRQGRAGAGVPPAVPATSGDALAMDELGAERRIHSCMPRLPGMVEATTAWTLADGGVGRDWGRRYGAPSDEGRSVGALPCSGEPTGGERRGRRARARLNLGGGRRLGSGHGERWRARGEVWLRPVGLWEGERASGEERRARGGP